MLNNGKRFISTHFGQQNTIMIKFNLRAEIEHTLRELHFYE